MAGKLHAAVISSSSYGRRSWASLHLPLSLSGYGMASECNVEEIGTIDSRRSTPTSPNPIRRSVASSIGPSFLSAAIRISLNAKFLNYLSTIG